MGENSGIEWTDHTFNTHWGCVEVSPACDRCYARKLAERFGWAVWGPNARRRFFGPAHWAEPVKWNREAERDGVRRRVFCASMADVFEFLPTSHPDAAELDATREQLWRLIEATPNLDWLLLTKRPQNMKRMAPKRWRDGWPANVVAMTTIENQHYADVRIWELLNVPAQRRGLSIEPLLGPVRLDQCAPHFLGGDRSNPGYVNAFNGMAWHPGTARFTPPVAGSASGIQWVIVGGESGHGARPMHPAWVRSLRQQCAAAGVPFFFKQWGEWSYYQSATWTDSMDPFRVGKKAAGRLLDGRTWDEFPEVAGRQAE